jgi:hypothetical protein
MKRRVWWSIIGPAILTMVVPIALGDGPKAALPELLKLYTELGLPLPSKDAKLVRYEAGGGGIVNGLMQPKRFALAFELKAGTKTEPPTLLRGVNDQPIYWIKTATEVQPTKNAIEGTDEDWFGLPLAIQCQSRGWEELAGILFVRSQKNANDAPQKQLLSDAWDYWADKLTSEQSDRVEICKRLKDLVTRDKELNTDQNQALIKSLDLALLPSKSKPGSIDALIDKLVDFRGRSGMMRKGFDDRDDSYISIAKLGFEAVPALIEHLDDERLTRGLMQGFNNFQTFNLRVQHVVSDLLEGLAGTEIEFDWLRRQQGWTVKKEDVIKWWLKAQKENEEAYLLKHFLDAHEQADGGRGARINHHRLYILQAKYPKRIAELYKETLDKHPDWESFTLADALLTCSLPKEEKIDLYLHAIKNKPRRHHAPALRALRELNPKRFAELLMRSIEDFPKDTNEAYWSCDIATIAHMAAYCDDPGVWPLLEKVVRRSSLGLRMEILHAAFEGAYPDFVQHRLDLLSLLAQFLDDPTLRDRSTDRRFEGPGAGFPYNKIEVRDAVALDMASLLRIDIDTDLNRSPEEWAKIRDRVKQAMKREMDAQPKT